MKNHGRCLIATSARDVLDDDGLPKASGEFRGKCSSKDIVGPTSGNGHDQFNGLIGVLECPGVQAEQAKCRKLNGSKNNLFQVHQVLIGKELTKIKNMS